MSESAKQELFRSEVTETSQGRGYWLDRPWVDESQRTELVTAPILVVPWVGGDAELPSFPTGTEDLLARLANMLDSQTAMRVAIRAADYQEMALHSKARRLPTFFITSIALPLLLNLLSSRLDELLPGHKVKDTAEITLIVEGEHHKVLKFKYKGPVRDVGATLAQSVDRFIDRLDTDSAEPTPKSKRAR